MAGKWEFDRERKLRTGARDGRLLSRAQCCYIKAFSSQKKKSAQSFGAFRIESRLGLRLWLKPCLSHWDLSAMSPGGLCLIQALRCDEPGMIYYAIGMKQA